MLEDTQDTEEEGGRERERERERDILCYKNCVFRSIRKICFFS